MTVEGSRPPTLRFRFVQYGGGIEEIDRFAVRDRIRAGDILRETELAPAGTDDWRAAASYPELVRYFELAGTRSAAGPPQATKVREVRPMSERVVHGVLYPLLGGQVVTVILLAVFSVLPIVSILSALATIGVSLEVIRKSAEGSTKMPALVDTSEIGRMIWLYFRVIFVTLVSLLPLVIFIPYAVFAVLMGKFAASLALIIVLALLAFAALYYPACLATIAVWDDALSALNPVYVVAVIRKTGRDYLVVVGMWFVASVVATIAKMPAVSPLARVPIAGAVFSSFLSLWVLFYASHLLGYAIYRHAPELGWE